MFAESFVAKTQRDKSAAFSPLLGEYPKVCKSGIWRE